MIATPFAFIDHYMPEDNHDHRLALDCRCGPEVQSGIIGPWKEYMDMPWRVIHYEIV